MITLRNLLAIGTVCLSIGVSAGIEWPSDFWSQVTNYVSAVTPTPVTSSVTDGFYVAACTNDAVVAGTVAEPFDTRVWVTAVVDALLSGHPGGFLLFFQ